MQATKHTYNVTLLFLLPAHLSDVHLSVITRESEALCHRSPRSSDHSTEAHHLVPAVTLLSFHA